MWLRFRPTRVVPPSMSGTQEVVAHFSSLKIASLASFQTAVIAALATGKLASDCCVRKSGTFSWPSPLEFNAFVDEVESKIQLSVQVIASPSAVRCTVAKREQ